MKIAIFSDSHDNLANLDIFLEWTNNNNITHIICCGDLTRVETLDFIAQKYEKPLHLVAGNADEASHVARAAESFKQATYHHNQGKVEINKLSIGFVHYPHQAEKMAQTGKYQYVFHGHTHMPWRSVHHSCMVVNPGTLAGMFYRPTFAVFDTYTQHLELKLIEKLSE
ncbi:MAG: metallophosphoesterase family protein [Patescibacteria group bacterium]